MRFQEMSSKEIVAYFDSMSIKPYDPAFLAGAEPAGVLPQIPDILELNRDVEPYVIQASAFQTPLLRKSRYVPLQFVHFSDVHAVLELWNRMVRYINTYSQYIAFALHTGDYCGDNQLQYRDMYTEGDPCLRPILNCVGNHDTYTGAEWRKTPKEEVWKKLFNDTRQWDADFMDLPWSMTYCKDFPNSNIRLIVLDQYYDLEEQKTWLKQVLEDAHEKGLWVISATHEPTAELVKPLDVTFHSITDYGSEGGNVFEEVLSEYIASGGSYICNLCGHAHHDLFGYSAGGVLNVAVECACDWAGWCDGKRVRGTRTYDCFNIVSIDTDMHLLKLVRVGDNMDYYLRKKQVLCYDYQNRNVIFNG